MINEPTERELRQDFAGSCERRRVGRPVAPSGDVAENREAGDVSRPADSSVKDLVQWDFEESEG